MDKHLKLFVEDGALQILRPHGTEQEKAFDRLYRQGWLDRDGDRSDSYAPSSKLVRELRDR